MKTIDITWDRFHQDTLTLADTLAERISPIFTSIVAVARGGLIPAAIIAKKLDIFRIETVCITSYKNTVKHEIQFIEYPRPDDYHDILVVDDIADSGDTIKAILEFFPNAFYATVYAKQPGLKLVGGFSTEIPQDTWVNFPWEPK